jgi:hypothetical protein
MSKASKRSTSTPASATESFASTLSNAKATEDVKPKIDLDDDDSLFATPAFVMAAAPKTRVSSGSGNQASATIHGIVVQASNSTITGASGQPLQRRELRLWITDVESTGVQDVVKGNPEFFLLPTTSEPVAAGEKRKREIKLEPQTKVRQLVGTVVYIGFFAGDDKKGPGANAAFVGSKVTVKNVVASWSMRDNVAKIFLNANGNIINVNNERVLSRFVDAFVINELATPISQSISLYNASHIYNGYFDPEFTCSILGCETLNPAQEEQVAGVQRMWKDNHTAIVSSLRTKGLQTGGDLGTELEIRAQGIEAMPVNELAGGYKAMFTVDPYDIRVAALTSKGISAWAPAPQPIKDIGECGHSKIIASKVKRFDITGHSIDMEILVMLCSDVAAAKKALVDTGRPDAGFLIPKQTETNAEGTFVVPSASVIATQSMREMARRFSLVEKRKLDMVMAEVIPYIDYGLLVKAIPSDGTRVAAMLPIVSFFDVATTLKRVTVTVSEAFIKQYLLDGASTHVPDPLKEGTEQYDLPKEFTTFPTLEVDGFQCLSTTPFKFSTWKAVNRTYHVVLPSMSKLLHQVSKQQRSSGGTPTPAPTINTEAGELFLRSLVDEGEDVGDYVKEQCTCYACL